MNLTESFCYLKGNFGEKKLGYFSEGAYKLLNEETCLVTKENELCVHRWHKILAHRNLGDVKKMSQLGITFQQCSCNDICDACVRGKMSRSTFPKQSETKRDRLECIVSDICGPMPTESVGKSRYFVTFIDEFSGYTEIEFMKTKSELPDKAIQFIEKLKTQIGEKPKIFRSDRGGEYLIEKFQN